MNSSTWAVDNVVLLEGPFMVKKTKVLVTGATGFVALHCIVELLKKRISSSWNFENQISRRRS